MLRLILGVGLFTLALLLPSCTNDQWERYQIRMQGQLVYIWIGTPEMVQEECTLRGGVLAPGLVYGGCHDPLNHVIITPHLAHIAIHEACHAITGKGHDGCGYPMKMGG